MDIINSLYENIKYRINPYCGIFIIDGKLHIDITKDSNSQNQQNNHEIIECVCSTETMYLCYECFSENPLEYENGLMHKGQNGVMWQIDKIDPHKSLCYSPEQMNVIDVFVNNEKIKRFDIGGDMDHNINIIVNYLNSLIN